mgnify:CR=1 FL=1
MSKHPARNADLAAIHIAKAQLGLTEDEYRDIMATVCAGIRSAAQLDFTGRKRFLAHLQACIAQSSPRPARPVRKPLTPVQRKVWALWMQLADAKLVEVRSMAAITAWVQRQTGVERLEWLNGHQEDLVIECLKQWLKRREEPSHEQQKA